MKKPSGRIVKTRTRGIEHEIRAHHAADRARRADHRDAEFGSVQHLRERRGDAAQQIEHQEARPRHRVFDVVAEQPQEPHVADQVHPAAVHEHRREDVRVLRSRIGHAHQAIAHLEADAGAQQPGELAGNEPEVADRSRERDVAARALHEHPRQRAEDDDDQRDDCRTLRLVLVVVGNH